MELAGLRIVYDAAGWRALTDDGVAPDFDCFNFVDDEPGFDAYAYVISANIHRRHLTGKDKDRLIAAVLKTKPELSNRAISAMVKADHKTVAAVRGKAEANGEIPHKEPEQRIEASGRKARGPKPGAGRTPEGSPALPPAQSTAPNNAVATVLPPEDQPMARGLRLSQVKELVSQLPTADLFRFGRWFKEEIDPEPAYAARKGLPSAVVEPTPLETAISTAAEPVQQPEATAATDLPAKATVAPPLAALAYMDTTAAEALRKQTAVELAALAGNDPIMDAFLSSSDLDATQRWAFGNWKDHPAPEGASSLFVGMYRDAGEPGRKHWRGAYMARP